MISAFFYFLQYRDKFMKNEFKLMQNYLFQL